MRALLDARRGRLRRSTRPWSAASTTTRARSSRSSRDRLGAQSELGGGGRYDGLIEQLGGPPTPAVGWAAGIERILLALGEAEPRPRARDVFVASPTTARASARWRSSTELRRAGLSADSTSPGAALKGQMKQADRLGRPPRADPRGRRRAAAARHASPASSARSIRAARRRDRSRTLRDERRRSRRCGRTATATPGAARCSPTGSTRRSRVAGWVHRRRDHGGLIFIDLRDRTGLVQLVFNPDEAGEAFELGHKLRAEDVLSARGHGRPRAPRRRSTRSCRPASSSSGSTEAELLADAETPPFEIEGFSGEVGEETRLRHRYLDLRREPDARGDRAAPPGHRGDARVPRPARASSTSRRRC